MKGRSIYLWAAVAAALCVAFGAVAQTVPADHQAEQTRPIQLGTSGGNVNDISSRYCCSGTLGALVQDAGGNGFQYILSNNHVLAKSNLATIGDPISQPGLIDNGCIAPGTVAYLADYNPILFLKNPRASTPTNLADAAIAVTNALVEGLGDVSGAVDPTGSILGIGAISAKTVQPLVGLGVQKSGRTTGHTIGNVAAVNVSVKVGYSTECGGAATKVGLFVNQFSIGPAGFSDGGDSGSLIVETRGDNEYRRAMGLLFAGSSTVTIASPIDAVLDTLGVEMVGPRSWIEGVVTDADGLAIEGAAVSVYTGQSDITDQNGYYFLDGVPVGTNIVTVTKAGYITYSTPLEGEDAVYVPENDPDDPSDDPDPVNIVLQREGTTPQSHVQSITYTLSKNKRNMYIAILVVDDAATPVPGAEVSISVTLNGNPYLSPIAATGTNGVATFTFGNAPDGIYETTVTDAVKDGLTYDGLTPENSFTKPTDPTPAVFPPQQGTGSEPPKPGNPPKLKGLERAQAALAAHGNALFNVPDVVGHGIGVSGDAPVIEVYLSNDNARSRAQIPKEIEGVPVRVVVTGPFIAY